MESMVLGSPVHSPVLPSGFPSTPSYPSAHGGQPTFSSLNTPTGGVGGTGFLPGYLMGDPSQQSTGRLVSPSKLNRSLSSQSHQTSTPQTPAPLGGLGGHAANASPFVAQGGFLTPNSSLLRTPSEKPGGGPPTRSLFSMRTPQGNPGTPQHPSGLMGTPVPTTPQLSFGATPSGPSGFSRANHTHSIREDVINSSSYVPDGVGNWVTVFGFPPSASGYILSQFAQCGTVLQHHIPPNGNWMHIKFQTKLQAQKALTKSNKVMGGSIMIGVSPCTDPNVEELNTSCLFSQSVNGLDASVAAPKYADSSISNLNSSIGGTQLNRSIRPLAQAYKLANNEHEISGTAGTPNRSSGIVSKAMEFIFGW
eukprot:maker-scaffold370_size193435-snap-gene-0.42 protein:Tk07797 transcript:maker-scaffold370_size193435-snap-gene-0.42-mRNA-1 annotation:"nucleoporin nup53 isoform x3"